MNDQRQPSIDEVLADHSTITAAVQKAVREAVLQHARAGKSVATCRNGEVVWVPAEEILTQVGDGPSR